MNPSHLLDIGRRLAGETSDANPGRPRQTDLCRAVSVSYYAMFHTLALCNANMIVGSNRGHPAWSQAYRALEHGHAKNQCNNQLMMSRFPPEIQRFGRWFVDMQRKRHVADYDPEANFQRSEVIQFIEETEQTIASFESADRDDRRAFSVFVLFRLR